MLDQELGGLYAVVLIDGQPVGGTDAGAGAEGEIDQLAQAALACSDVRRAGC